MADRRSSSAARKRLEEVQAAHVRAPSVRPLRCGGTMMDTLSAQDASFLFLETPRNPMHVGSVMIFENDPPPIDDLVAHMASKLPEVPRYRQKVRFVPLRLARPVWIDDPDFRLEYHLRHTALPKPGGERELLNLAS